MKKKIRETPDICVSNIFEISGVKLDADVAFDVWPRILLHKWLMSEKLGRDVGLRVACIDFLENIDQADEEYIAYKQSNVLRDMGAQTSRKEIWDTIADSQLPKQLVQRKIILPLIENSLSQKHGVVPPRTILFFGPPGTGKTRFAKAIAGALSWWFIEIAPSMLTIEGIDKVAVHLRKTMEKVRDLEQTVIFIDEFEELAGSREEANRIDKSITNELLKQIPLLKSQGHTILLICATNHIRQLDSALLRPGRFDCIIPVGGLNEDQRKTILEYYISRLHAGPIDLDRIIKITCRFTPADIEYLFQQVAQFAFEQELATGHDYRVTTDTFFAVVPKVRPSLTDEILTEFEKDMSFSRV